MKKIFKTIGILFFLLLTACATILNSPIQKIIITTDKNITNVTIDSTNKSIAINNTFYIARDKKPLIIHVQHDTTKYDVVLKSKLSSSYFFNLYPGLWEGFWIDYKNHAKYVYPKRIHIQLLNDSIKISRFAPVEKGTFKWLYSLPYINTYRVKKDVGFLNSFGYLGIGVGVEYYYNKNKYLSLNLAVATDSPIPFPAAIDYFDSEHHICTTSYINLRNNFIIGRFDFGYGLNFSNLYWRWSKGIDSTYMSKDKYTQNLGLCFESQYRFGEYFRMGLLYQPQLIDVTHKPTFDYQHFISIEFVWKFQNLQYNYSIKKK